MTLRRYAPLKASRGTVIPGSIRLEVIRADGGRCVGPRVGMDVMNCRAVNWAGPLEIDHVRTASFARKSATERSNLVALCPNCHREKTFNGRKYRPLLLAYIAERDGTDAPEAAE